MSYPTPVNIEHQTVLGEDGKPTAALIPWPVFEELRQLIDDDTLTSEEEKQLLKAEKDLDEGNWDAFVSEEEIRAEFGYKAAS